jgi:WD40 repeat protein
MSDQDQSWKTLLVLKNGYLVSGSEQGNIAIWDTDTDTDQHDPIAYFNAHTNSVNTLLEISGGRFISGSDDKSINVWNVQDMTQIIHERIINIHNRAVTSIVELKSELLPSASEDKIFKVWKELKSELLASAFDDGIVKVWNINKQEEKYIKIFKRNKSPKPEDSQTDIPLMVLRDKFELVHGSYNGNINVINLANETQSPVNLEICDGSMSAVAQLHNGDLVFSCNNQNHPGNIIVWDMNTSKCKQVLKGHTDRVSTLLVIDHKYLVSSSWDKTIRVWDMESGGKCKQIMDTHKEVVMSLSLLNNDDLASASIDGLIHIWTNKLR